MTALEQRIGARGVGAVLGLTAALLWGSQFPVAKSLFANLDAYTLTALRWGIATLTFVALLALLEGRGALRFEGRFRRAAVLGSLGIVGGVLLPYVGLEHTPATTAALGFALQPLLTAIVLRLRHGVHLTRPTLIAIVVAFAGVLLVISRGDLGSLADGSIGWGVWLVFVGQVGWVVYTVESVTLPGWSALRFTALTALPATVVVFALAGLADQLGWAHPGDGGVARTPWLLAYAVLGPAIIAVLAWNAGRARIGAQDIALFQNLVPITTFAIEIGRGYRPDVAELVGAPLTIAALIGHNIAERRRAYMPDARD